MAGILGAIAGAAVPILAGLFGGGKTVEKHVYEGVDREQMRKLEESIRAKNNEMEDLKKQSTQKIAEAEARFSKEIKQQEEAIKKINRDYEENMKRIEEEKAKQIGAMKEEMKKREEQNAKNLQQMQLSELLTRVDTLLQSSKQIEVQYQQMFRNCQEWAKECVEIHKQAEKEKSHLNARFKYEGKDEEMIRFVLYGPSGHGKSTLGNRICGDDSTEGDKGPFTTGGGTVSVTDAIQKHCVEKNKLYKYGLSVTDQPGTDDTDGKDRIHANNLVDYLRGIGYINAIGIVKTYQPPRLDYSYQSMLRGLEDMLGSDMWKHVVIILTHTNPSIQDTEAFKEYCQTFQETVRKQLQLNKDSAPLPIIGIELNNLDNCRKQLPRLINQKLASLPKFYCKNLKSPLDDLETEKKHKIAEFESKFKELMDLEEFLINLDKKLGQSEQEIAKRDPKYQPIHRQVSRNLTKQIKRGWNETNSRDNNDDIGSNSEEKSKERGNYKKNNENINFHRDNDNYSYNNPLNNKRSNNSFELNNSDWPCVRCTYINKSTVKNCEMCENPKPK